MVVRGGKCPGMVKLGIISLGSGSLEERSKHLKVDES